MSATRVGCSFIASLARRIVVRAYVRHERCPIGYVCILKRGLVVKNWRFYSVGGVWGEDVIIDRHELLDHSQAVALSFCEVYTLTRRDIEDVLSEFPEFEVLVRKAVRKVVMQRLMLLALSGTRPVRSFIPRSQARGFTILQTKMTLEQKMDVVLHERPKTPRATAARHPGVKRRMAEADDEEEDPLLREESPIYLLGQRGAGAGHCAGGTDAVSSLPTVPAGRAIQYGAGREDPDPGAVPTRTPRRSGDSGGQPTSRERSGRAAVDPPPRQHASCQPGHGSPLPPHAGQARTGLLDAPLPPGDEDARRLMQQMVELQKDLHSQVQAIGARVSEMSAGHTQMAQQLELLQRQAESST